MRPPTDLISYRTATGDDAREIARLAGRLGYPMEPDEARRRLARLLSDPDHQVVVAVGERSELVGWVHVEHRFSLEGGARAELMGLVVDPSARRNGVGGALVERAEAWTASRGLSVITVRSNIVREESHPFYEALGYAREKSQHVYSKPLPVSGKTFR